MKTGIVACVAAAVAAAAGANEASPEASLCARLPEIFAKSAAHYRALDAAATPLMKDEQGEMRYPHGFRPDKREIRMCPVRAWTAGHFPGSLWYIYEATGDAFFRDRALVWTEIVAPNSKVTSNHDVGFIMFCSFGNARRLLQTDRFDALLAETAESLSSRFNESIGLIRSWGKPDEDKNFLVIPDNMMNLELLEEASKITGNGRYAAIARSHADVTMKHHFRADGGCYHVLNYDQRPGFAGRVQEIRRGQGLGCESAWSRGQSWAVYGYTMMYRETKNPAYLAFAQKLADFAVNNPNMPADGVPYWDYGAPGEERDSSAGAILASALLELSGFASGEKGAAYRAFAVKQLLSLSSQAYFSEGDEAGHFLLKHGVGHKPGNSEVDVSLNYGDYYFLEALLRFRTLSDRGIAGFTEPGDKRNLRLNPEWRARLRFVTSSLDGTRQPFYWYDPGVRGRVPLVVAFHSWSASCNWNVPATGVQRYCAEKGWAMAYPNFRGPNRRPEACGSDLAVQDVLDVVEWAKREREIDADRVYMIGGSGGGHFALLMSGRHPEVFAGAAAFCPISDLARWYGESKARGTGYDGAIAASCGGTPDEAPAEYARRSPLTHLANARAAGLPVYIVTGIHDGHRGSVPVGHSIRAFNALADERDRVSDDDIAYVEANERPPEARVFRGEDPFYGAKNRVMMRATSANARLTIFDGGHGGNTGAGLDFLSRQRRGRPANFTLPATSPAASQKVEAITK